MDKRIVEMNIKIIDIKIWTSILYDHYFFILQQINIGHVAATLGPLFLALYVAYLLIYFQN